MTVLVDSCASWLKDRAHSIHSQFGEDGLIQAIFEQIGTANRWCMEVGAGDGLVLSNTKALRDEGWSAVLIEQDEAKYGQLETLASVEPATVPVHALVDAHRLQGILKFHGVPRDFDLCVIDIDGQDYWIWSGLLEFRPRVVMIEFSPYVDDSLFVPRVGEDGKSGQCQAGLEAIRSLGKEKGYVEVARTYCNVLFVRGDCYEEADCAAAKLPA